jgi:nucleoside-diphosphate-sugar epimerase
MLLVCMRTVLVTGGAGYLGCVLVPKLLAHNRVVVFDAMWFGREALDSAIAAVDGAANATVVEGDIRDTKRVEALFAEHSIDAVIHLAAVSNDPCSDLDADLTRSVNLEGTNTVMRLAKQFGVKRFVNASSASVYGIKADPNVTEELLLEPLTLYAKYKAETEDTLNSLIGDDFCGVSLRAATVCGYSPRLRLDLTINILTYHALTRGEIRVFGGDQMRPNIHIQDLTDFYLRLLDLEASSVNGRAFNVVKENFSVMQIAEMVRDHVAEHVGGEISIRVVPTEDNRSYHLSAKRAEEEFGFAPQHALSETMSELAAAFSDGRIEDPHSPMYRNIEVMKSHPEKTRWPA